MDVVGGRTFCLTYCDGTPVERIVEELGGARRLGHVAQRRRPGVRS